VRRTYKLIFLLSSSENEKLDLSEVLFSRKDLEKGIKNPTTAS